MSMPKDPSLLTWTDALTHVPDSALLLGNGASIAVWDKFTYSSLYLLASEPPKVPGRPALSDLDKALFSSMGTKNFEQVLGSLSTAILVSEALKLETTEFSERYESIRSALVEAVRGSHIPWSSISKARLSSIRAQLLNFSHVFTTNYDLLIYWTIMSENGTGFKDFFWAGDLFDVTDTDIWGKPATLVYYLHGGLHLARTSTGRTVKRKAQPSGDLLSTFGDRLVDFPDAIPLFVSEGTAQEKLASIYRSDYLAFAYSSLSDYPGPLCLYGISLDDTDSHLRNAIQKHPGRDISIGLMPRGDDEVVSEKARFRRYFPKAELYFFDSTTHPLGKAPSP